MTHCVAINFGEIVKWYNSCVTYKDSGSDSLPHHHFGIRGRPSALGTVATPHSTSRDRAVVPINLGDWRNG